MDEKRQRTACFTGHRQLEETTTAIEQRVARTIESLIQQGYLYFGAGGARGFDALASKTVLRLKKQYPKIHLILILPFEQQYQHEQNWREKEVEEYYQLRTQASKVVILAPAYYTGAYYKRNRHLISHSSVCIAYMTRKNSGTGYTVNYAEGEGVPIINLAVTPPNSG